MDNFALDLSSVIIHLEYQRKRLLENPEAKKKMCSCRVNILNNFTVTIQKLIIRLCSRTIKYAEDYNIEKATAFDGLKEWYNYHMYDKLIQEQTTSNKMVLLFELLQKDVDDSFFDKINKSLRTALVRVEKIESIENVDELLEGVLSDVKKWFEMFILNLISIQINCQHIDNKIFTDFDVENDDMECAARINNSHKCSVCANIMCNACCRTHSNVTVDGEKITLIVTREMVNTPNWIENFYATLVKYHTCLDEVTLRLDYRMFDKNDPLIFVAQCQNRFNIATQHFKKIQIKNYDGVVYGSYLPVVQPFFTECEKGRN